MIYQTYIHRVQVAITTPEGDHEVIPILRSLLRDNPPRQGKVCHTTGAYVPYSFRTVVSVLLRPTRTRSGKVLWDGTLGFSSSVSEKISKSHRFQMSLQRQHFPLRHLKTLSVGPAGVWTRDPPLSRPTLAYQANQAELRSQEPHEVPSCIIHAYPCTPFNSKLTLLDSAQFYSNSPLSGITAYLCNVHTGSYELVIFLPSVLMSNRCYSFSGSRTPVNVVIIRSSSLCLMDVRRFVRNEVSSRP